MRIRAALRDEIAALSNLCCRSKAHWGYNDAFMALSRDALTVSASHVEAGDVWVAEVSGAVAGVVSLSATEDQGAVDLDKMFVDPAHMRLGVGRVLMEFAIAEARRRGFKRLRILADPNAAPFYERMGAVFLRHAPSDAIPGRTLPLYEMVL